jgi:hypothetical protein
MGMEGVSADSSDVFFDPGAPVSPIMRMWRGLGTVEHVMQVGVLSYYLCFATFVNILANTT